MSFDCLPRNTFCILSNLVTSMSFCVSGIVTVVYILRLFVSILLLAEVQTGSLLSDDVIHSYIRSSLLIIHSMSTGDIRLYSIA